jgi:hypothetical protein
VAQLYIAIIIIIIQFFIIYVPSQELQGQIQTQHVITLRTNNVKNKKQITGNDWRKKTNKQKQSRGGILITIIQNNITESRDIGMAGYEEGLKDMRNA